MSDVWTSQDKRYEQRLFFNKDFCEVLVTKTILQNYYKVKYVKTYLESFSEMMSCKINNSTKLTFEIPPDEQKDVISCMYFKDKYFFYFCEKYCEKYHLTNATPQFDGEIENLRKFVEHF